MARILVVTNAGRVVASFYDDGGEWNAPIPADPLPTEVQEALDAARQEDLEREHDDGDIGIGDGG